MAGNRTLTIIKPDAFNAGKAGLIIALLEKAGFKIVASRVMRLTDSQAQAFYSVHRERPFFAPLVRFEGSSTPRKRTRSPALHGSVQNPFCAISRRAVR